MPKKPCPMQQSCRRGSSEAWGAKERGLMEKNLLRAHVHISKSELDYWECLLEDGEADLSKEKLAPLSCVFVKSVRFDDGYSADIKVCSGSLENGGVWSEVALYNPHGDEVCLSEIRRKLSGIWELETDYSRYEVYVEPDAFCKIGIDRCGFVNMIERSLMDGISGEYVGLLADRIAEGVADDVSESADIENWNSCDVSLGVARVILKALGVEV